MQLLRAVFLLFLIPFFTGNLQAQHKFRLQTGDLLFQDLDCGDLCNAIESVTNGYKNATFSHVGIAKVNNGTVMVLEAIGPDVHYTPLETFLNRSLDAQKQPKVAVGRLKKNYQPLIPEAFAAAENLVGKPYDEVFDLENDAYYCSELIYFIFLRANNHKTLFQLSPMTYKDPATGAIMPVWQQYFADRKLPVPENEPGLNPGGMSRSKALKMYFPYGKCDVRKNAD